MTPPDNQSKPKLSPTLSRAARIAVWVLIPLCCLECIVAGVLLGQQLRPSRSTQVAQLSPSLVPATATPTATLPPPTPTFPCGEPKLTLGQTTFQIKTIARAADGSIAVPSNISSIAYWVEGTNINYVFALSPTPRTLALETSLKTGDKADIRWGDCSSDEYVVRTLESGQPDPSTLFDQTTGGITVFVQTGPSAAGLVIRGGRPEAQAVDTPSPTEANAIQAEILFRDIITSPDGQTLTLNISVKNTGPVAFSLTANDISLTAENAAPLAPLSVEPTLPREITPGASETFVITFPKPAANTAVFKILDFSGDIFF